MAPISNFIQLNLTTDLNAHSDLPRNIKFTIFHDNDQTNIIISDPDIAPEEFKENFKHIHSTITSQFLILRKNSKFTNRTPHDIHLSGQKLLSHMQTKLAQLRVNKSCKVVYIQYTLTLRHHIVHCA